MTSDDAESRAERLGAAMLVCGLVHEPACQAVEATAQLDLLTDEQWEAWHALDGEDGRLAQACLALEFERRNQEWASLLLYLEMWSRGSGTSFDERLASLDPFSRAMALSCYVELGWHLERPGDPAAASAEE